MVNDNDCRLLRVIYQRESSSKVRASREGGRGISIEVRCKTDEENRIASEGGVEECPGTCKLTPALHHRSSNQEEARVFSKRGEERDDVKQKVALALRCDDAKMSLVVQRNEKVCAVFIQKASLVRSFVLPRYLAKPFTTAWI